MCLRFFATPRSAEVDVAAEITKLKKQLESYKPLEEAVLALQAHVPPPPSKASKGAKKAEEEDKSGRGKKGGSAAGGGASGKGGKGKGKGK